MFVPHELDGILNVEANQLTSKMKEINIEKLPPEYREYVQDNIGVPKIIKGQQLFYCKNACHVNSILFSEFINTTTPYHCSVIEGIVVCKSGLAYTNTAGTLSVMIMVKRSMWTLRWRS